MIRFIDISTGNVFNPGNLMENSTPYIFWFDGEQSINLIYSKQICFISDNPQVTISMPQNSVFKLVDDDKLDIQSVNDINTIYAQDNHITKQGYFYRGGYVYTFYIIGQAEQSGEYIEYVDIDDTRIAIGADFYGENETLYVNLSNNGVEIPRSIQKSIYGSNILEDKKDNILLNRKWKELLSNLWDVMACKGSYKSLINSLKWFEYGDSLKMQEVWSDVEKDKLFLQDISDHMSDKYINSFMGMSKTTYYSLSYALDQIVGFEGNLNDKKPVLEKVVSLWSNKDMAMKLCLLGYFYKLYFMPIHLDLLFHTIENTTFMDNIKLITGGGYDRLDSIYEVQDIMCNVKDGSVYKLSPVQCYVGPQTLFGNKWDGASNHIDIIGVQREVIGEFENHNDLKNYAAQLYKDVGCIVDFDIKFHLSKGDFIKREHLTFKTIYNGVPQYKTITNNFIYNEDIHFSLLCQCEGNYEVMLQFDSAEGHTFTKHIKFSVVDTEHIGIRMYKIKRNSICQEQCLSDNQMINDFIFNRIPSSKIPVSGEPESRRLDIFRQYIPTSVNGIGLSHLLIYKGVRKSALLNNYFEIIRETTQGNYYIYVSKNFAANNNPIPHERGLFRQDFIFVPGFHHLEEFGKVEDITTVSLDDFVITDNDALCVIPELSYGKQIIGYEWEFVNVSTGEIIRPGRSIKEPFIAPTEKKLFTSGYYNIVFRYRLASDPDKINKIHWDSAFIKR